MKELTIEEKAKCYDEALERAKKVLNCEATDREPGTRISEYIFPELKESEDEKIRKNIIIALKSQKDELEDFYVSHNTSESELITWLEKQGKEEYALKSFKDEDVRKFMQYIEKQAKAYEFNLPNRGYDIYAFAKDILCWLEKQGEHKFNNIEPKFKVGDVIQKKDDNSIRYSIINRTDDTYRALRGLSETIVIWFSEQDQWELETPESCNEILENQDEQKDFGSKQEPKFKVGDWITNGQLTCKVLGTTSKSYELHLYNDDYCHFETDVQSIDKNYHLWTIKDAKPGDILIDKDNNIGLYRKEKDNFWESYIYLGCDHSLYGSNIGGYHEHKNTKLATKKQRDLLFSKMKEAGYEWDAKKKELKKIEQESIWSEEDEEFLRRAINATRDIYPMTTNWLKSLKQRIKG